MSQLSEATKKLISQYKSGEKSLQVPSGVPTIQVDEVAAKVAAFYERIRGIIDWREEHLLKRSAIERMLRRRFLAGVDLIQEQAIKETIAEPLVLELIRGGHYPNNTLPETKIDEVKKIIEKYVFILKNTPATTDGQDALRFYNWLLSICACEVEEILSSSYKERAMIDFMFQLMKERIVLNEGAITTKPLKEDEKNVQIYIAVQKALFKLDVSTIVFHLLKYKYPNWSNIDYGELLEITKNIHSLKKRIESSLNHPLADKFYQVCEKYDTPYLLLGDIVAQDPLKIDEKLNNPETVESSIRDAYQKRIQTLKTRLGRAAVYATLSIFLTKITIALAIEIPLDTYVTHTFNIVALLINIIAPPLLMFLLVSTVRIPGKENQDKVVLETMKIIYETDKKDTYEIKAMKAKRNLVIVMIIDIIYAITFALTIGLIVLLLGSLNFSVISTIIFILFFSLITFTGTKIRQRSKELEVVEEKEGFFNLITDLFSVPLVEVGKWLTQKWQRYNIISAFFNVLIDIPFMVFVDFIEQWRYFLKEKKEKIH